MFLVVGVVCCWLFVVCLWLVLLVAVCCCAIIVVSCCLLLLVAVVLLFGMCRMFACGWSLVVRCVLSVEFGVVYCCFLF